MKKNKRKNNRTTKTRSLAVKGQVLLRTLRWLSVSGVVIGCLSVGVYYLGNMAQSLLQKPIASIAIDGDFNYITKESLNVLIKDIIGQSFVGEDINQVQEKIEAYPWVEKISLSRQWPDRLLLTVSEQVPIARWGDKGFVNNRGDLIMTSELEKLRDLAELDGDDAEAAAMMQKYSLIAAQLRPHGFKVTTLKKDKRGAWMLQLNNGWQVVLGKNEILHRISRLTALLQQQNISASADIETIDARYENGIAIRWTQHQDIKTTAIETRG